MFYHVSPQLHLSRIIHEGLIPQRGPRSALIEDAAAIFLFVSYDAMVDGLLNWLGALFAEDEPLAIFEVALPDSFPIVADPDVGYEVRSAVPIPPAYIRYVGEL